AGVVDLPVYAGEFKVVCAKTLGYGLGIVPPADGGSVEIHLSRDHPTQDVTVYQTGRVGDVWALHDYGSNGPPFISVAPMSGEFGPDPFPLTFSLDCIDDETVDSTYYQTITGGGAHPARIDVYYDCRPDYFTVTPLGVAPGHPGAGQVYIRSNGTTDDEWTIVTGPEMFGYTSAPLPADQTTTHTVTVVDPRRADPCDITPEEVRIARFATNGRGVAMVYVVLPELEPSDPEICEEGLGRCTRMKAELSLKEDAKPVF
ncbi:MAG TPA: hypothetical protein PLV68_18400, partial [Ilumatobacteraceae bacterium]|nr:hypothetical protein [Ilumatobacteraceae bacterium]